MTENKNAAAYDVIIIGGGPAGLTAAIYTSRARLSTLVLERAIPGGQINNAELVENYPGFPDGIGGFELTDLMLKQAVKFGAESRMAEVTAVEVSGELKRVHTDEAEYTGRALIIANGSERIKLGVPGEDEFTGRGVSFCATCDGAFFMDKPVAVVGGGNAALSEAIHLTKFASRVYVIHRRDQLRATKIVQERAMAESKIEFVWDSVVEEVTGDGFVKMLEIKNVKNGAPSELSVAGVFVSIGFVPNTAYLKGVVPLDERGSIIVDENMATKVPGVFAAGDICRKSIWQVAVACGDGAVAAISAQRYLDE